MCKVETGKATCEILLRCWVELDLGKGMRCLGGWGADQRADLGMMRRGDAQGIVGLVALVVGEDMIAFGL